MNKMLNTTNCGESMRIESFATSKGYETLLASVKVDEAKGHMHDYRGKLDWVLSRACHYAEKTSLPAADILDAWEENRRYWYMNYYQDANQPLIDSANVRVFDSKESFRNSVGDYGFRCPRCSSVSKNATACEGGGECNWKSYGLLGTMGKGIHVFIKSEVRIAEIFMPVAWEKVDELTPELSM